MKKTINLLIISCFITSSSYANPLLFFMDKKKAREVEFVLETYGPVAFKCYYRITRGADFNLDNFMRAYKSGNLVMCMKDKLTEQVEYLKGGMKAIHR